MAQKRVVAIVRQACGMPESVPLPAIFMRQDDLGKILDSSAPAASAPGRCVSHATDADVHVLYWFVNDAYIGRSAPGQALYWQPPTAGSYTVRVVDEHGRSDQRPLGVSLVE